MHCLRVVACFPAIMAALSGGLAWSQGYSLEEAAGRMTPADGFHVELVAGEPHVRQPILVKFDDRGRLWVIQYLQYPNPAGLKRVKVDRYSRTVYDRIPLPPPKGPRGADRITILEDTDGDGRVDKFKDFIDGLNLTTGLAFGHGGVFVIQVPYLLFYPDRDRDDEPDGDPEVLLKGFGMEDSQAFANHLTWGPDGWLYGLNGSTTTCKIRGIEFQQGVWRYHPITREFELFCEGGGNVYGMTFDAEGNLFYSSNGTRPSWHGVQGAYYHKAFGKHGELHNPYAFGYFQFVEHTNYRGGHVTCGGSFYYGDTFPASFRGTYIATNLLAHEVHWHTFGPCGSTFRSKREGELLLSNDTWFAPTDLTVGPDGAVYVCDFHDRRTAHPDPDADWDLKNGRVYRIRAAGATPIPYVDLHAQSSDRLVDWLDHTNMWYVRLARRILAERRDESVVPRLRQMTLQSENDQLALESLWALNGSGGFDDAVARRLLHHRSPAVRSWTVRLLGDPRDVSAEIQCELVDLARTEPSVIVRSQLACTAKRLPGPKALPIIQRLLEHAEDRDDPHVPLLLWWAVEDKADSDRQGVLDLLTSPGAWKSPLADDVIHDRLIHRYAMQGTNDSLEACVRLVTASPPAQKRDRMLAALDEGLSGRKLESAPASFLAMIARFVSAEGTKTGALLHLALRCGVPGSDDRILQLAADPNVPTDERVSLIGLLGEIGGPDCLPTLLPLLHIDEQHNVEIAVLNTIAAFDDDRVPAKILREYPRFSDKLKAICVRVLLSRPDWALAFLHQIDEGKIDPESIDTEQLRGLAVYENQEIDELVRDHWGKITRGTPEEKLADIRRFNNDLRAFPGRARAGQPLFTEHCASCHKLFEEGEDIGPDLTTANRKDQDYMLVSMVDPSSFIRVEFLSVQIVTEDGRILSGLITDETPTHVTLVDSQSEETIIARTNIDEIVPSEISQMPEDLLTPLTPQQLRDLIAYLRSDPPAAKENSQ
jgi:putative membrane-bound dehydrogenase-like protein